MGSIFLFPPRSRRVVHDLCELTEAPFAESIRSGEDRNVQLGVVDRPQKHSADHFPNAELVVVSEDADPSVDQGVVEGVGEPAASVGPSKAQEHLEAVS